MHWHYRRFDRILLNGLIQPFQPAIRLRDKRAVVTNSCENPRASALRLLHQ
jgi:hypothetical protein